MPSKEGKDDMTFTPSEVKLIVMCFKHMKTTPDVSEEFKEKLTALLTCISDRLRRAREGLRVQQRRLRSCALWCREEALQGDCGRFRVHERRFQRRHARRKGQ